MKIAFYTLGCKVNQFETQAMELICKERGHSLVEFEQQADAYVLNTCTVTATSDKKSRQALRKTRRMHPDAVIAVCGCFPQVSPEQAQELDCADVISGSADRVKLIDLIEQAYNKKLRSVNVDQALKRREYEVLPAGGLDGHTRAMLKVQDGCTNFCSYCIIPYARGPVRSLSPDKALEQARELAYKGYKEIVVTGIEISSYGKDLKSDYKLVDLLETLLSQIPQVRFRLGSLEPRTVDEEFCARLSVYENLCPQFHLSLQSGCDETLKRMRRKYDSQRYYESVRLLNEAFPNCAITTDLIVGFPGESEEEFSKTLEFIEKCAFSDMHIFPYSKRKGTPAADMPDQVLRSEKEARAKRAAQVSEKLRDRYLQSFVGKDLEVLFEEEQGGRWVGHAQNYVRVQVETQEDLRNQMRIVAVSDVMGEDLRAQLK